MIENHEFKIPVVYQIHKSVARQSEVQAAGSAGYIHFQMSDLKGPFNSVGLNPLSLSIYLYMYVCVCDTDNEHTHLCCLLEFLLNWINPLKFLIF